MKITINGGLKDEIPEFYIQTFSLLFFPEDNIFGKNSAGENHIDIFINQDKESVDILVSIWYNNKTASRTAEFTGGEKNFLICAGKLFYEAAGEIAGIYPPWGIHTGIRPAKTAGDILEKNNFDERKTLGILREDYLMSTNKANLAIETYKNGKTAVKKAEKNDFSLYISIPFCPTRCKYCSFVSFSTPKLLKLIPAYVKKLTEEIEMTGKIAKDKNMNLRTVYIGGGTPATLDCESMESILSAVRNNFDLTALDEYTVECGRADVITEAKLKLLKRFEIDRISVNPQSLNDGILLKIGRNHTSEDFFKAFEAAKKTGIKNINADCIIGLPGEPEESIIETVRILAGLKPANITVHALCIKRSAELKNSHSEKIYNPAAPGLNGVFEKVYDILRSAGYKPYYMYRQKYAAGNLENTGFCLEGRECLYNIYMMDELHTIFGAGAGAMTKIVRENRIERIANYKYPYEYIEHDFQINREINKRKLSVLED